MDLGIELGIYRRVLEPLFYQQFRRFEHVGLLAESDDFLLFGTESGSELREKVLG